MLDSRSMLRYFIEYEKKTALMENSLSQVDGELFSSEILNDLARLQQLVQQKRRTDICKKVTSYPDIKDHLKIGKYSEKELNREIDRVVSGSKPVEEFTEWLSFKYKDNRSNSEQFICNLLEEAITICYPILKKTTKKETSTKPLITFIGRIEEEKLKIEQFYINRESLEVVVAWLTNHSTFDVGEIEKANLLELMNANRYSQQQDLHEILNIFNKELEGKYQKDLKNYKTYEGWHMLAQVFVTFEMLEEMKRPIFQKEIERILELTKNDESPLPELLHTYLTGGQNTSAYIKEKAGIYFHFGSYTNKYPVNEKQWHILDAVQHHSLLSVNGPPGTGKSTLLKEIFADNMVMKAKKLTEIWDKRWEKFKERGNELYRFPLSVDERTFSMVLTSTNNTAVDNIGLELLKEVSYFEDFVEQEKGEEVARGFFCARLGKKANKEAFMKGFLPAFMKGLETVENQEADESIKEQFIYAYHEVENLHLDIEQWREARDDLIRFYVSQDKVLDDPATDISSYQMELNNMNNHVNDIVNSIFILRDTLHEHTQEIRDLDVKLKSTESNLLQNGEIIRTGYKTLEKFRVWKKKAWLGWLFPKRRAFLKQYISESYIQERLINNREKEDEQLRDTLKSQQSDLDDHRAKLVLLEEQLHQLEQQHSHCNETIQFLGQVIGMLETFLSVGQGLSIKWGFQDVTKYSTFDFSSDRIVLEKRYQLFQLSLKVTEQYVKLHAKEVMHNLVMVCNEEKWFRAFYNDGNKQDRKFSNGIKALWNTIFLCFPVVTSTLHSFGERTFQLLPGLIDTLLVDEAGQIMPHYLSSPLYRSQRAVIVGDIEQLGPVRLLKTNVIEEIPTISEEYHKEICIQRNSAQSYIDRNSDIYELDHRSNKKGLILTEHRRCEESIMYFSNKYVYGGILTIVNPDNNDKLFGSNLVAVDVRGLKSRTHINMTEVRVCQRLIETYVQEYGEDIKKEIGIITPFTKQKDKLKKEIPGVDIGTVHTFQGQEKRIIIFSSVIDSLKQTGIASFIGGSTNLLNVALSRAKEQFVLLGNMEVISQFQQNHLKHIFEIIRKNGVCISPLEEKFHTIAEDMDAKAFSLYIDTSKESQGLLDPFSVYLREHVPERLILHPKDHYLLLMEALRHATKSVVIFSPWIMSYVVNEEFIILVQAAMDRQVEVRIGFGYQGGKGIDLGNIPGIVERDNSFGNNDKNVASISSLKDVMGESLYYIPPIHSKILLVDDRFLFLGSHNWLSKIGKHKRDEISCLVTEDQMIKYLKERYIQVKLK